MMGCPGAEGVSQAAHSLLHILSENFEPDHKRFPLNQLKRKGGVAALFKHRSNYRGHLFDRVFQELVDAGFISETESGYRIYLFCTCDEKVLPYTPEEEAEVLLGQRHPSVTSHVSKMGYAPPLDADSDSFDALGSSIRSRKSEGVTHSPSPVGRGGHTYYLLERDTVTGSNKRRDNSYWTSDDLIYMYEVTVHEYGITTPGASGWGRKRDDVWVNKDLHGQFPYWTRNKLVKRSDWMPPTVTVTRQPIHVAAAAYMIFHCRRSKSDTTTWQNYSVAYRVMKKLLEEGMPEKELKLMVDLFVSKRVTGNIKSSTTVPVWREFQSNAQSLYKQVQGNIRMRSTGAAVSIEDAKKLARWT